MPSGAVVKGAVGGSVFGCALLVAIAMWSGLGVHGATGERLAFGLTLALVAGMPLSLLVGAVASVSYGSRLFPALYGVLLLSVVLDWAVIGSVIGWSVKWLTGVRRARQHSDG